ncbi:tRNA (N6-isopentenyl adenosine(37)-C2)-methylthiotransferase MiaB [bacterium (candidate division B38) B3_B38]|nr:MAG: tRNA (N6-isopentenyl adenosine(37)-C2)-methylthiotransferase MiaB [bacterium (candidate division B38) B3_B38]
MHMKFYIYTFGCQMSEHDSEYMAAVLLEKGYSSTEEESQADIVLVNTCCVREKVEHKIFTKLGRLVKLKKKNRELIIGVTGCYAQLAGEVIKRRMPLVDFVLGTQEIRRLPVVIDRLRSLRQGWDKMPEEGKQLRGFPCGFRRRSPVQAMVTIIEGCNNFCAYCIVPFARGKERSRAAEEIEREVKEAAAKGYIEVLLLGQNVNSYFDPSNNSISFADLLIKIHQVEGIERIRFITSHPKDFSYRLVETIRDYHKICNHVHLPVQSGSTRILKLMNRKYSRDEYMEKIEWLKREVPEIGISTDIIVGFPEETEDDFQQTIRLVKEVKFDGIYSFKYSPRPLTKANQYPDTVPEEVKGRRLMELQGLQKRIQLRKNQSLVGRVVEILVDNVSKKDPLALCGRTSSNRIVNFKGGAELMGKFLRVKIIRAGPNSLFGERV